jgi:methylated-DNA-[protein]-cysteine S-methyltransferase
VNRTYIDSPVGPLTIVTDDDAVVNIHFGNEGDAPRLSGQAKEPVLRKVIEQLKDYFDGNRKTFDVPLALRGTPFQLSCWNALRAIEYGETRSYSEIARVIGRPAAVRAVGAANGANPIPIIIPCHRVIGSNGALTGFGGGLDVKRRLLDFEAGYSTLL